MSLNRQRPWIVPIFIPQQGCRSRCVFCNQKIVTGMDDIRIDGPVVKDQIEKVLAEPPRKARSHVEIAFYGGDFTGLSAKTRNDLLRRVGPYIQGPVKGIPVKGIRISCRPDSLLEAPDADALRSGGVRTVELGVQSLCDDVLSASRRGYRADTVKKAVRLLKNIGFEVGLHLMFGLPGEDREAMRKTVERTIALGPDFVRIHPTLVLRDTVLETWYRAGTYRPLSMDEAVEWCEEALVKFNEHGIPVSRIGLQPVETLMEPGAIAAGPFHPAFRELVEGAVIRKKIKREITGPGDWTVFANPSDVSRVTGPSKTNMKALEIPGSGVRVRCAADRSIPRGEIRVEKRPESEVMCETRNSNCNEPDPQKFHKTGAVFDEGVRP